METVTENTPATVELNQEQQVIAEKKKVLWADLGLSIYKQELALQAKAQQSLAKIKMPTRIESVVVAESILKEVKADQAAIQNERKLITSQFDTVAKRLMEPEKSFEGPLADLTNAIIALKKADEEKQRAARQKIEQTAKCREFLILTRNNADSAFKTKILEKINKAYEYALGAGDVALADLPDFIVLMLSKLTDLDFKIPYPLNSFSQFVTTDEFMALCKEILIVDAKPYLAEYENELRQKFSDYEVAINNKAQALQLAQQEKEQKAQQISAEKVNADTAAKLESISVTPTVMTTGKALKKSYEIDMPETVESMIAIMTAFTMYIDLCMPKLKVNKWFAFTPAQAAISLAKVKCDDNDFSPAGLTFKTVDKL